MQQTIALEARLQQETAGVQQLQQGLVSLQLQLMQAREARAASSGSSAWSGSKSSSSRVSSDAHSLDGS